MHSYTAIDQSSLNICIDEGMRGENPHLLVRDCNKRAAAVENGAKSR